MNGLQQPLVSIGLPTVNRAGYLDAALRSLLGQDYRNLELIVSDNASTDYTAEVCDRWGRADARLRYIRQSTFVSPEENYLCVLNAARADYFMWAADDDLWEPAFLSALMSHLAADPEMVFAMSNFDVVNYAWNRSFPSTVPIILETNSRFQNCLNYLNTYAGNFFYGLFRREYVYKTTAAKGGDFSFVDLLAINEILSMGKAHVVPEVLYHAGITQPLRRGMGGRGKATQFLGMRESYAEYYTSSLGLFSGSPAFTATQRVELVRALNRQIVTLVRSHEHVSPRIVAFLDGAVKYLNGSINADLFTQRAKFVNPFFGAAGGETIRDDEQASAVSGHLGMFDDGWVVNWTRLDLWNNVESAQLVVDGAIPLVGNDAFTMGVEVLLDDVSVGAATVHVGDFVLRLPVAAGQGRHRVELRFDETLVLPQPDGRTVSALLKYIGFEPQPATGDPVLASSRLRIGRKWHDLEHDVDEYFHWAQSGAEVAIDGDPNRAVTLVVEVEPGPGVGSAPFDLRVAHEADSLLLVAEVSGRQMVRVPVPSVGASSKARTLRLVAAGGGKRISSDPRVLDFRVFRLELVSGET